jgi:putative colanic acid biosynthesis UDP-glucose lipid carrier transferase
MRAQRCANHLRRRSRGDTSPGEDLSSLSSARVTMLRRGIHGSRATFIEGCFTRKSAARRDSVDRARPIGTGQAFVAKKGGVDLAAEARRTTPDVSCGSENRGRPVGRVTSQGAQGGPNCRTKRVFDFVVAVIAIVGLLPLFCLAAMAVMLDTRGPILFRQWRGGRNGRRFQILKFRTMSCMEDGVDVCQVRPGDARVTRVGRVLRKTSVDEFPQLFNVLRGDMSLVGPRPHALLHDTIYSELVTGYAERQSVRPGMTGWAQVNGCRGETRDIDTMERRIKRDLEYIRHWSFRLDLIILAKTVNELLRSKYAY